MRSLPFRLEFFAICGGLTVASCAGTRSADPEPASPAPPVAAEPAQEPAPVASAALPAAHPSFERAAQGWRARVPSDWEFLGEVAEEQPNGWMDKVVFELPPVWSELEGQSIANAVAITAIRRHGVSGVASFQFEHSILHPDDPRKLVEGNPRLATRDTVNWEGLDYEVQLEFAVRDRMGYVIGFTATPGTFAINYPLFRALSDSLELFEPEQD